MNFTNICTDTECEVTLSLSNLIHYVFSNFRTIGTKLLLWKIFLAYEDSRYLLVEWSNDI